MCRMGRGGGGGQCEELSALSNVLLEEYTGIPSWITCAVRKFYKEEKWKSSRIHGDPIKVIGGRMATAALLSEENPFFSFPRGLEASGKSLSLS